MNAFKKLTLKNQNSYSKSNFISNFLSAKLYNFSRFVVRVFSKKYKFDVKTPTAPTVYVSRHLNMHGPITILKSATFKMHPFIIHDVLSFKECFLLFYNYTFSKKIGVPKFFALVPAFLASLLAPILCRSTNPVPVFRKSASSLLTVKIALSFLDNGKNLLIFPDVNYLSKNSDNKEIYDGFLNLDKLYFKTSGQRINFIPLIIDEKNSKIKELPSVFFTNDENFDVQKQKIKDYIINGIFS